MLLASNDLSGADSLTRDAKTFANLSGQSALATWSAPALVDLVSYWVTYRRS